MSTPPLPCDSLPGGARRSCRWFFTNINASFATVDLSPIYDICRWFFHYNGLNCDFGSMSLVECIAYLNHTKTYFQWVLLFLFLPLKMSRYHGYQLYNFFFFKYIKWSWWKRVLWNSFLTPWSWISYFRNKMKRYICIHSETEPQRQLLRCDNLPPFKIVN